MSVRYALISVSDKAGAVESARSLVRLGFTILSTGGTAKALAEGGVAVTEVAQVTRFPEILDGRVKTLHPAVHAGILARRDVPAHQQALAQLEIGLIDVGAVNLYPFETTVARPGCPLDDAIENIDIGGSARLRAGGQSPLWGSTTADPG